MTLDSRESAVRLVLVEQRRDTVAVRDASAARVRRFRLARTQVTPRPGDRDAGPRGARRPARFT